MPRTVQLGNLGLDLLNHDGTSASLQESTGWPSGALPVNARLLLIELGRYVHTYILRKSCIHLTNNIDGADLGDSEQSSLRSLDRIGIIELLEQDSRPTFIIDLLAPEKEVNGRLKVTWSNKSLKFFDGLRSVISTDTFYPNLPHSAPPSDAVFAIEADFKEWAVSMPDFDNALDGFMPRHEYKGMYWSCCTLRKRWRVISASQVPNQRMRSHGTPRSSRSNSRSTPDSTRSLKLESQSDSDALMLEEDSLSKQLADSESKFRVLTELSPVGMYYLSPDGGILYCNDMCKLRCI